MEEVKEPLSNSLSEDYRQTTGDKEESTTNGKHVEAKEMQGKSSKESGKAQGLKGGFFNPPPPTTSAPATPRKNRYATNLDDAYSKWDKMAKEIPEVEPLSAADQVTRSV